MNNKTKKNLTRFHVVAVLTLGLSSIPAAADVVLVPGKIDGNVQIGSEVINYMRVQAHNSDDSASQNLNPDVISAPYSLTVNVPTDTAPTYTVRVNNIRTSDTGPTNYDYFSFPTQSVVAEENTTKIANFTLANPAYIDGSVTLTGSGKLNYVYIWANPTTSTGFSHYTNQYPDPTEKSTARYEFPVSPGELRCSGIAYLASGARINLPSQIVSVNSGNTASCNYTIATPETGSIEGQIGFTGSQVPNQFNTSVSGPTSKNWSQSSPTNPDNYSLTELSVGNYTVWGHSYLNNSDDYFRFPYSAYDPSRSTAIAAGGVKTINIDECQAYLNGTISLQGSAAIDDLNYGHFRTSGIYQTPSYGGYGQDRIDLNTGDYDLVLSDGDWYSSQLYLQFYRPASDPDGYLNNQLYVYDRSVMPSTNPVSLACGATGNRNFDYRMGTVTVNFSIAGGGEMSFPRLRYGSCSKSDDTAALLYTYQFYASSNQSNVSEGSVTFVAPEGQCTNIEASAMVDGTQTTFGEFDIEVVAGADVVIDIGGPGITVDYPEVGICVDANTLTVTGTATDDVGVADVTVNGVNATLEPTGGEGILSTTFTASIPLAKGENTINTIATDTSGKTGSDTRIVHRDTGAPVLTWNPNNGTITQEISIDVTGTVVDDVDVELVTVNGEVVTLVPTGNPGEYTFSKTVPLVLGENTITVVATDASGCTDGTVEVRMVEVIDNTPPTAVCQDVTVSAGAQCSAVASINNGSFDPDGDPITIIQSFDGPFGLGSHTVALTVTDDSGASDSCNAVVTVVDTTPPELTLRSASSSLECGLEQWIDPGVTAVDNCSAVNVIVGGDTVNTTTPGAYSIIYNATDESGNKTVQLTRTVLVQDTTAPNISASLTMSGDDESTRGDDDSDEGRFKVNYTISDMCDANPQVTSASLNPVGCRAISTTLDQRFEFEHEDEECEIEYEEDGLEIEAPGLTLVVIGTDASGNTANAEAVPTGLTGDNEEDDDD